MPIAEEARLLHRDLLALGLEAQVSRALHRIGFVDELVGVGEAALLRGDRRRSHQHEGAALPVRRGTMPVRRLASSRGVALRRAFRVPEPASRAGRADGAAARRRRVSEAACSADAFVVKARRQRRSDAGRARQRSKGWDTRTSVGMSIFARRRSVACEGYSNNAAGTRSRRGAAALRVAIARVEFGGAQELARPLVLPAPPETGTSHSSGLMARANVRRQQRMHLVRAAFPMR